MGIPTSPSALTLGAQGYGGSVVVYVKIHKQAHPEASSLQPDDGLSQCGGICRGTVAALPRLFGQPPTVVRGQLGISIGYERYLSRLRCFAELEEARVAVVARTGEWIALYVELDVRVVAGQQSGDRVHILWPDVTLIGTWVYGYAVSPSGYYSATQRQDVGPVTLADLKIALKQGDLSPESLCWASGIGGWKALKDIRQLRWQMLMEGESVLTCAEAAAVVEHITWKASSVRGRYQDGDTTDVRQRKDFTAQVLALRGMRSSNVLQRF